MRIDTVGQDPPGLAVTGHPVWFLYRPVQAFVRACYVGIMSTYCEKIEPAAPLLVT